MGNRHVLKFTSTEFGDLENLRHGIGAESRTEAVRWVAEMFARGGNFRDGVIAAAKRSHDAMTSDGPKPRGKR